MMSSSVVGTPAALSPAAMPSISSVSSGGDLRLVELDPLVDKEAVLESHRLVGHRLVDAESVGVLGGRQVAVLEPALERCTRDLELDPAIDVIARSAPQPAALRVGKSGDGSGILGPRDPAPPSAMPRPRARS